jgi:hypothetical protein
MAEFYRVVRVRPNGTENIIRDVPCVSVTDADLKRATSFAEARAARDQNGWRVRVYGYNEESPVVSPGDLIWDSAVNS